MELNDQLKNINLLLENLGDSIKLLSDTITNNQNINITKGELKDMIREIVKEEVSSITITPLVHDPIPPVGPNRVWYNTDTENNSGVEYNTKLRPEVDNKLKYTRDTVYSVSNPNQSKIG